MSEEDGGCVEANMPHHVVHFDTTSPDDDDADEVVVRGLAESSRQLLSDLLQREPSARMSVTDACSHPFFTSAAEDSADPLQFHHHHHQRRDLLKLPRRSDVPEGGGPRGQEEEERAWARRQCSMVWSPMPAAYDFQQNICRINWREKL